VQAANLGREVEHYIETQYFASVHEEVGKGAASAAPFPSDSLDLP
jgi:hypothetical protein